MRICQNWNCLTHPHAIREISLTCHRFQPPSFRPSASDAARRRVPVRPRSSPCRAMAGRGRSASSLSPRGRTTRCACRRRTRRTGWRQGRVSRRRRCARCRVSEPVRTQGRTSCRGGAQGPFRRHIQSATGFRRTVGRRRLRPWRTLRPPRPGSPRRLPIWMRSASRRCRRFRRWPWRAGCACR